MVLAKLCLIEQHNNYHLSKIKFKMYAKNYKPIGCTDSQTFLNRVGFSKVFKTYPTIILVKINVSTVRLLSFFWYRFDQSYLCENRYM